jgi:hypothetical protein
VSRRQHPIWLKSRPVQGALGALILVIFAFSWVNRTQQIQVSITVDAIYGGFFTNETSCVPAYSPSILDAVTITDGQSIRQVVAMPENPWTSIGANTCRQSVTVVLAPGREYTVRMGTQTIGTISSAEFSAGSSEIFYQHIVTRDLKGTFELVQYQDSCRGNKKKWTCSHSIWRAWGIGTDRETGACWGQSGYSDIRLGTTVTIYNSSGAIVGGGSLTDPQYDLTSVASKRFYCEFKWSASNIPNDDVGYSLEIASRGRVFFSSEQLKSSGWELNTVLGE